MWACRALPQMYWHTNYYVNISVGKNWAYTNTLFFATLTMMISFHTLMKYIITIIPEVSYLISFLQFYYTYFTGLLFLLSRIRIRNIQKETTKIIFSLYKMKEPFTISGLVAILSLLLQV